MNPVQGLSEARRAGSFFIFLSSLARKIIPSLYWTFEIGNPGMNLIHSWIRST
jgi:hypothetical protein